MRTSPSKACISVHCPFSRSRTRRVYSPRKEFTISSAGFWTQEATAEWLLTKRPDIRHEHASFAKGILAFDVLTSFGYGDGGVSKPGRLERDTRGMAATGIDERAIGAIIMVPAALDTVSVLLSRRAWAEMGVARGEGDDGSAGFEVARRLLPSASEASRVGSEGDGPSANVIVPSRHELAVDARFAFQPAHPAAQPTTLRFDHDDVARVDGSRYRTRSMPAK